MTPGALAADPWGDHGRRLRNALVCIGLFQPPPLVAATYPVDRRSRNAKTLSKLRPIERGCADHLNLFWSQFLCRPSVSLSIGVVAGVGVPS